MTLQDIPIVLFFIIFILLFLTGNFIYLFVLMRKNNKNKKVIQQAQISLERLQKTKEQIEQQGKEKNLFFTCLIHELKVPLSIIQSSLDLYLQTRGNKFDKTLATLKANIESVSKDIINLLDAEKITQTQFLYNHDSVLNITYAVKQEIEVFKSVARKKEINLILAYEDSLFVKINATAFARIMNNLLDNAIKHTQKGGEIHISVHSIGSFIHLVIKDTGSGIPENKLNDLFKPYYQVKREKNISNGLGLGLYLVKNIVDSACGEIKVNSTVGKGTEVTVVFQKVIPGENDNISEFIPGEPLQIHNIKLLKETYDKDKFTIMIVEDNLKLLEFLQQTLINNYNIYYAENGEEALEKLKFIPKPDIIISDIMMPVMDGYELFSHISEMDRYKDIPFIFLTSRTAREEKLKSLKMGVIDFISKPFLIEEVKAKIESILRNRIMTKETEMKRMEDQITTVIRKKEDEKFLSFEKRCKKYQISPREKEVIQYILKGLHVKEIAAKLFLSIHTIRNHIRHIYSKCKVQNQVELLNLFRD